jgi:Tyrosine phosphatase family
MQPTAARRATRAIRAGLTRTTAFRARALAVVPLVLGAAFLMLPVSLPAQVLTGPTTPARPSRGGWPELPQGEVCPSTPASLPGRGNFLSIRKFSPVGALEGCTTRWNDDLHRHFFRGSPPSRRGLECLGRSFGVTHLIDLRRPDEIQADSSMGGFRTEEQILGEYNQRHPDHPMRYFNVRTTRETPEENERQIQNVARYVEQALIEDPSAVFYLHCRAGRDRTGVMVAAIQSLVGGCPWPEVRRELFAYRFTRNYTRALLLPLRHALGLDP